MLVLHEEEVSTLCGDNLEWVSRANNWNKFNAVATLGNIHKGHEAEAMTVLKLYLPEPGQVTF